jgi:Mn-dependent DtxR family transcriptional regulator
MNDEKRFTSLQGQYLAFIHSYSTLNRTAPAESDFVRFFEVTPPTVHSMIVRLESLGLIERQRGVARSIRLTVEPDSLPKLQG